MNHCPEAKAEVLERVKKYQATPHGKAKRREYQASPKGRAKVRVSSRKYQARPEQKAKKREYDASPERRAKRREYNARPEAKATRRESGLRTAYGITLQQWGVMLGQQEGRCAICAAVLDRTLHTHVDHCHTTGRVRGLLCGGCNRGLGHFGDSPGQVRAAAEYLERFAMPKQKEAA